MRYMETDLRELNIDFISARDAYDIALESYATKVTKKINELKSLIEDAAEKGELKLIYNHRLYPAVIQMLNLNDYQITEKTLNNSEKKVYIISWDLTPSEVLPVEPQLINPPSPEEVNP